MSKKSKTVFDLFSTIRYVMESPRGSWEVFRWSRKGLKASCEGLRGGSEQLFGSRVGLFSMMTKFQRWSVIVWSMRQNLYSGICYSISFKMRPRISIRGHVRPLVGPLVRWSVRDAFVKIDEKWPFTDWTRKKEGQGGRRNKEERGTSRKEGRGGRSDEESEKMKKL